MKNKIIKVLLALTLILSFFGCSQSAQKTTVSIFDHYDYTNDKAVYTELSQEDAEAFLTAYNTIELKEYILPNHEKSTMYGGNSDLKIQITDSQGTSEIEIISYAGLIHKDGQWYSGDSYDELFDVCRKILLDNHNDLVNYYLIYGFGSTINNPVGISGYWPVDYDHPSVLDDTMNEYYNDYNRTDFIDAYFYGTYFCTTSTPVSQIMKLAELEGDTDKTVGQLAQESLGTEISNDNINQEFTYENITFKFVGIMENEDLSIGGFLLKIND